MTYKKTTALHNGSKNQRILFPNLVGFKLHRISTPLPWLQEV